MSEETEPSIGTQLRARRIELGQPLSAFAAKTRIRQIYLEALEEDRYEVFPGEAYLAGFLKGYAAALGLDPEEMVAHYRAKFGAEPGELAEGILPAATVVVPARGPSRGRRRMLVTLVIVVVALGFLYYLGTTTEKAPLTMPSAGEHVASPGTTPTEAATTVAMPAVAEPAPSSSASQSSKSKAEAPRSEPASTSQKATPAAAGKAEAVSPPMPSTAETDALTVPPGGTTLHIEATGTTSIVLAIDGRSPQKYDLLPGSTLSWRIGMNAHLHVDHSDRVTVRLGKTPVLLAGRTDVDFSKVAAGKTPPEKGR